MADSGQNQKSRTPKSFVLCFDGTGNKFSGTDADSNILKIYRMLDRGTGDQYHYYQPGIGTYVTSGNLEQTGMATRVKSWYAKAKDSAVGTSFAHHVMGGYKFLMRYYTPGDDIYLFGFSRGAYTARFLAEMLDWVGLLSAGNEELARFAWKTFSKWQSRRGGSDPDDKKNEEELYAFMQSFRETFSRPVKRIRFLGLFDTVNSVPRFESAWMQRSKFPYSAKSSAKVIRHAVAINERRAKFRQDLVAATKMSKEEHHTWFWKHHAAAKEGSRPFEESKTRPENDENSTIPAQEPKLGSVVPDIVVDAASPGLPATESDPLANHHSSSRLSLAGPMASPSTDDMRGRQFSVAGPIPSRSLEKLRDSSRASHMSRLAAQRRRQGSRERKQDIEEVWFPGCHADIGGGWPPADGEEWPLSHAPLVWMVREAQNAGLRFDPYKMAKLNCCPDEARQAHNDDSDEGEEEQEEDEMAHDRKIERLAHFHGAIQASGSRGLIHDCLEYGGGLPASSVLSWKIMEYLPFRRMDLKSDGSWEPIRWPLPCGETRDMPEHAIIHRTAITRMKEDKKYRPGNLIVGGGGRGMIHAPEEHGIGKWEIWSNEGDAVLETYIRAKPLLEKETM